VYFKVIHVLYVDDEPALLELTKLFLERSGDFSVDTAISAQVADGMVRDHHYDVIISDYQMPGMDGIEFLQQIRQAGNPIPFIIFTGRGREEVVIEAINNGADSYLQKGGNPRAQFAELEHKIHQIVRGYQAEQKLREGASRFRALFKNISDIIQIFDEKGRIIYDSPSSARILGYPPETFKSRDTADSLGYVHPDEKDRVLATFREVVRTPGSSRLLEFRLRRADGEYLWVESVLINKFGVEGVNGLIATTRPIAERKEAEEELRKKHEELHAAFEQLTATEEELRQNYNELAKSEQKLAESERQIRASEAFLRCVITDVQEGITAYDTDLRFTLWNQYMEDLTGIPGGDVVGKRLEEQFPQFMHTDFPEKIRRVLAGETVESSDVPVELSIKKEKVWLRFVASPLFDHEGHTTGIIALVQDITPRKEMELALLATTGALRESEEKYRSVFEAKNNPLILVDAETQGILDLNQAASELYGYTRDEMLHLALIDLSAEPEKTKETIIHLVPRVSLRYHQKKDGTIFPADIALAHFTFLGRSVLILSVRDLTGVQQIDDALRIANVKLNLMIGVTRHDVLNSLTALLGYNEILKEREADVATREMLEKQEKALLTIRSQIEFTRSYDDLGIKAPVWQHVGNTAARAYAQFINTILFTCEIGDLEIYADPMLEKVFYNLFDNAFRYGEGVTKIRIFGAMDGTDLLVYFEDDGVGIPDPEKARIFSRGIGKNTGLGLFLTREILAITRIGIQETGEYRKGARFTLRIPRGAYRLLK
jgi:PAS domain S-box-containing protein